MNPENLAEILLAAGAMEPHAAALHYAQNGVPVFPCDPVLKSPLVAGGFKNATANPDAVRRWWNQWPAALIGGPTGISFDVLDMDGEEAQKAFRRMAEEHGTSFTGCLLVKTPRAGGWHMYFTASGFKTDAGQVAPGVDRRGNGGYIILPGSRRADGVYMPRAGELRPAPLWLVEAGKRPVHAPETAPRAKTDTAAPDFTENDVRDMLDTLNPDSNYTDWLAVGMALHAGGFAFDLWDNWSRRGSKYTEGETAKKWESFDGKGVSIGTLFHMAEDAGYVPPLRAAALAAKAAKGDSPTPPPQAPEAAGGDGLPVLFIPDGHAATVADAAKLSARVLSATGDTFNRGGVPMEAVEGALVPLSSPVLVGRMEPPLCRVFRITQGKDGKPESKPAMLTETSATRIILHRAFRAGLPPLKYLSRCPVLLADKAGVRLVQGYDKPAGVLVQSWKDGPLPDMKREDAAALLLDMLKDFRFQTESDKARAIAFFLTPAFLAGDLLGGRAPVGLVEADASQAGKGFLVRLVGEIYNLKTEPVTEKKGGVGSFEESFSSAVVKGAPIVLLDNLRGKLNSPMLESATTEDVFSARVPHCAAVNVDVSRLLVLATSNRAELSVDMSNRVCAVRLRKQPPGFNFTRWPAGGLQEEIRANRPRYLSAVLAIARAWVGEGRPRTDETRISGTFRAWCRPMDWICRNYFDLLPLLDGNEEAQTRAANPALNWLRDIALAAKGAGLLGAKLQAAALLELIEQHGIEPATPPKDGEGEQENWTRQTQAIGRRMKSAFKDAARLEVDGFIVHRWEENEPGEKPRKVYTFTEAGEGAKVAAPIETPPEPQPMPAPAPLVDEPDTELADYAANW